MVLDPKRTDQRGKLSRILTHAWRPLTAHVRWGLPTRLEDQLPLAVLAPQACSCDIDPATICSACPLQQANAEPRPELAWIGIEPNTFGTDEFMQWCEEVGTEPYLCLNFGTGTLDEGSFHSITIVAHDLIRCSSRMA